MSKASEAAAEHEVAIWGKVRDGETLPEYYQRKQTVRDYLAGAKWLLAEAEKMARGSKEDSTEYVWLEELKQLLED